MKTTITHNNSIIFYSTVFSDGIIIKQHRKNIDNDLLDHPDRILNKYQINIPSSSPSLKEKYGDIFDNPLFKSVFLSHTGHLTSKASVNQDFHSLCLLFVNRLYNEGFIDSLVDYIVNLLPSEPVIRNHYDSYILPSGERLKRNTIRPKFISTPVEFFAVIKYFCHLVRLNLEKQNKPKHQDAVILHYLSREISTVVVDSFIAEALSASVSDEGMMESLAYIINNDIDDPLFRVNKHSFTNLRYYKENLISLRNSLDK